MHLEEGIRYEAVRLTVNGVAASASGALTRQSQLSAILRKLEAKTRGEATVAAAQLGLLEDRQ